MNRAVAAAFAGLLAVPVCAVPASAGIYGDELSKCLVASTTADDREAMILWSFAGLSQHPSVKNYVSFTEEQRTAFARRAIDMFQRMLLTDCRAQMVAALKFEGVGVIAPSFQAMGLAGARGLSSDPAVAAYIRSSIQYLDRPKLEALIREAGVDPTGAAPPPPPIP